MSKVALVVDDSMTIRKLVSRTLAQAGFQVVEASNGQEGLEALAKGGTMSVIISDVNMPVMDGFDFVRGVRETESHRFTPVIFLTTETEDSHRDRAREVGATAWVAKPFKPEKILSVVQRIVP